MREEQIKIVFFFYELKKLINTQKFTLTTSYNLTYILRRIFCKFSIKSKIALKSAIHRLSGSIDKRSQISVLRLFMSPQINFSLECFVTQLARKGLEPGMLSCMSNEIWALTECFSAHAAFVRLLTWKEKKVKYLCELNWFLYMGKSLFWQNFSKSHSVSSLSFKDIYYWICFVWFPFIHKW